MVDEIDKSLDCYVMLNEKNNEPMVIMQRHELLDQYAVENDFRGMSLSNKNIHVLIKHEELQKLFNNISKAILLGYKILDIEFKGEIHFIF